MFLLCKNTKKKLNSTLKNSKRHKLKNEKKKKPLFSFVFIVKCRIFAYYIVCYYANKVSFLGSHP